MPERPLDAEDLRPELRSAECRAMFVAFLEVQVGRVRLLNRYRELGHERLTLLDATVNLYVFAFRDTGTRQASVVTALQRSRRTIRDSLDKLESVGLVWRSSADGGLYYPAVETGRIENETWPATLGEIARLCDTFAACRGVVRNPEN